MSDVLKIAADGTSSKQTLVDATIQLPVWTFDAGTGGNPGAGQFQLDNAAPNVAANIYFNFTAKNGGLSYGNLFGVLSSVCGLVLTDSTGKSYMLKTSAWTVTSLAAAAITSIAADGAALSGDYTLSFFPVDPTMAAVLSKSGITPVANGTVTPVTSITTDTGVVTADS